MADRKAQLRELMKQTAASREQKKPKISSPFAQFNTAGQLMCTLCGVQVKSELHWPAHANSKQHKEALSRVDTSRSQQQQQQQQAATEDRSPSPPPAPSVAASAGPASALPAGFFDDPHKQAEALVAAAPQSASAQQADATGSSAAAGSVTGGALPTGFFDDKARETAQHAKSEDAEWAAFEREVVSAAQVQYEKEQALAPEEAAAVTAVSATGRTVADEELDADRREDEETHEHLQFAARLDALEDRVAQFRHTVEQQRAAKRARESDADAGSDSEDEALDGEVFSLFDWRAKNM